MHNSGIIKKMKSSLDEKVSYQLPMDEDLISLNQFIGGHVKFLFNGDIFCIKCNIPLKKTFAQGYCFPCFRDAPETSECILRPELCRAHEGESRDMEWSKSHCLTKQYVYMSFTGNFKIGVTRFSQIPTRWIDQGATSAVLLCETPNRHLAGVIEIYLKQFYSDRTNWRKMLSDNMDNSNFESIYSECLEKLNDKFSEYIIEQDWVHINYPILAYPDKIKSISFDKENIFEGKLIGIKGQYLLFENNRVLNIRKHTGYKIELQA